MFEIDSSGHPVQVRDLDADWLLELVEDAEVAERKAGRTKLRLAARWAALHPATEETGVATWDDASLPGLVGAESLGGDGTPPVAAFTPEPFAATLGLTTLAGAQLIADALDLEYRLPEMLALVEDLVVPPWRARQVAQATHHLSREAAAHVDRALARRAGSLGPVVIARAVAQAAALHHPEPVADAETEAKAGWGVRLSHGMPGRFNGTSWLEAAGDTLDLTNFHDLVCRIAAALGRQGDTDPLEARKAKALGIIADQQATLDLLRAAEQPDSPIEIVETTNAKVRLYLHASLTELLHLTGETAIGDVEKLGPATLARIKEWVGHSRVTVQPVLDLGRTEAVDPHDPPAWMRELVHLRDRHCVFPFCNRDSRSCDLDHIVPYDPDGPPGQTNPDNLAPLCRRHHRAKTHSRWRYRRHRDGSYTWTAPEGRRYLVTPTATRATTPA